MTKTWVDVADGERQQAGQTYRSIVSVRMPYNDFNSALITAGLRTQAALTGDFEIQSLEVLPPLVTAHESSPVWSVQMVYVPKAKPEIVQAGLDPRVILSLVALVVAGIVATGLLSTRLQKLVQTSGDETRQTLVSALPVGLLLFAGFALFILKR